MTRSNAVVESAPRDECPDETSILIDEMCARLELAEAWDELSLPRRLELAARVEFESSTKMTRALITLFAVVFVVGVAYSASRNTMTALLVGMAFGLLMGWIMGTFGRRK